MAREHRVPLRRLRYAEVDHAHLIDREREREDLLAPLEVFATDPEAPTRGITLAVVGDKGVGKSILTRAVLEAVQAAHSGSLLILDVDARGRRRWREVLTDLCARLREELQSLADVRVPVPGYALPAAALLRDLCSMDTVNETLLREVAVVHTRGGKLGGAVKLRGVVEAELGLDLRQTDTQRQALQGTRVIDEHRLARMLNELLADLAGDGLRCVVFLDNLDELDHSYDDAAQRARVRQEVEGLLGLGEAPIALVLNVRTYFAGALGRLHDAPVLVSPLAPPHLIEALERRLQDEEPSVQRAFAAPEARSELGWLARVAGTPLNFLYVVAHLAKEGDLRPADRASGLRRLAQRSFPNFDDEDLDALVAAFKGRRRVSGAALEAALGASLKGLAVRDQAVLPRDFWSPEDFTLDARLLPLKALIEEEAGCDAG